MELLVKPEMLTSYIYGPTFDNAETVSFYLLHNLTLRLLMSYIYGAPSKARNANVAYIWTYVWQR